MRNRLLSRKLDLGPMGNRGRGRGALPSLRLRAPLACIACIKTRDAPTDICTVPQAACYCCCAWATIHSARVPGGREAKKWRAACPLNPNTQKMQDGKREEAR